MVRRTVWFSLFCLIALTLLVSVKALSPFAGRATPKTPDSFVAEDTSPLAVKSDRLPAAGDETVPEKIAIKTVKVVFPPPALKENASSATPQRSAYASMRSRSHKAAHRHHKKKYRHRR